MPNSGLEETLDAAGYAKVIVALRPAQAASLTTGATAMVAASIANVRDSLQNHFIIPSESQFASLAMAAKRATGRRAPAGGAARRRGCACIRISAWRSALPTRAASRRSKATPSSARW